MDIYFLYVWISISLYVWISISCMYGYIYIMYVWISLSYMYGYLYPVCMDFLYEGYNLYPLEQGTYKAKWNRNYCSML